MIDEVPILAVRSRARAEGVTEIRDAEELRVKESDRIRVLARNLGTASGCRVEELPDGLRIHGACRTAPRSIPVHHDHRIAMAFGVLGALPGMRIVVVDDPEVADVSFPGFWAAPGGASCRGPSRDERAPSDAAFGTGSRGGFPGRRPSLPHVIDGPAGSGSRPRRRRWLSSKLGFTHLDSGALYRALTLALLRKGIPEEEWERIGSGKAWAEFDVRLEPEDSEFRRCSWTESGWVEELRSPEVTGRVPRLARDPRPAASASSSCSGAPRDSESSRTAGTWGP
jgi:3-phosphoshikimate 1-carboxyvinyltransferase